MDAASDFNSEDFGMFLQKFGVKSRTCATEGLWQNSRVERHGGILQMILNKMDHEEAIITSYSQLATALAHATMTKNQWSKYRGYPPETLDFGKGSRMTGSVISDEETASHHAALNPSAEGIRIRAELACRERARRAFVSIDNYQVLRRALTSRSRPNRGQFLPGDWIMLWKRKGEAEGSWEGPMQVIIQAANRVIWVTKDTKLCRAAPEHVRPLPAVEERNKGLSSSECRGETSTVIPQYGGTQFHNLQNTSNSLQGDIIPSSNSNQTHTTNNPSNSSQQEIESDPEPKLHPRYQRPPGTLGRFLKTRMGLKNQRCRPIR